MSKNTKFKDYILDIFAVEHHQDDNYVIGFGFKKDKNKIFDRQNFQLNIKKECSLNELSEELFKLSIIIKEVINSEERI